MLRVLACALVVVAAAAVPAYGAAAKATLAFGNGTVRGTHFHRGERVRVRMTTTSTVTRVVRATASGTFTLAAAPYDRCADVLVIVAVGASGDSARLKVMPRACPPAP